MQNTTKESDQCNYIVSFTKLWPVQIVNAKTLISVAYKDVFNRLLGPLILPQHHRNLHELNLLPTTTRNSHILLYMYFWPT